MERRTEPEEPRAIQDDDRQEVAGDERGLVEAIEKKFPRPTINPPVAFPWKITPREISNWIGGAPSLMLEIGCNDGTDTAEFLSAFPMAEIVAFEPDPRAIAKFKARIQDPRCTLVEAALSDENGFAELYMSAGIEGFHDPEWDKSSSICRPTRHLIRSPEIIFPNDPGHRQMIETMTMDTWWVNFIQEKPYAQIDFVWCDPQGAQAKILLGGQEAMAHVRYLYIEYYENPLYEDEPTLYQIIEMLPGWELVATYENENALLRNGHAGIPL